MNVLDVQSLLEVAIGLACLGGAGLATVTLLLGWGDYRRLKR